MIVDDYYHYYLLFLLGEEVTEREKEKLHDKLKFCVIFKQQQQQKI